MKAGILYQNFWPEEKFKEMLALIAKLGYDGVQVYVTKAFSPQELSGTARKEIKHLVGKHGLVFSAVCADFGKGFANPQWAEWSLEKMTPCLPLAKDFGTDIITTHIGRIPQDVNDKSRKAMTEVMKMLAGRAASNGCRIAIETGPEDPAALAGFLKKLDHPGLAVNYDPSNLTRRGFDAIKGVSDLTEWIVHTHAKDGLRSGEETALGEGDVDWQAYIAALSSAEYDGFLTVEREQMKNSPEAEAKHAAEFLKGILK